MATFLPALIIASIWLISFVILIIAGLAIHRMDNKGDTQ